MLSNEVCIKKEFCRTWNVTQTDLSIDVTINEESVYSADTDAYSTRSRGGPCVVRYGGHNRRGAESGYDTGSGTWSGYSSGNGPMVQTRCPLVELKSPAVQPPSEAKAEEEEPIDEAQPTFADILVILLDTTSNFCHVSPLCTL